MKTKSIYIIPTNPLSARGWQPVSAFFLGMCLLFSGCRSPEAWREQADNRAQELLSSSQEQLLGRTEEIAVASPAETLRKRLLETQHLPHTGPASRALRDLMATAPARHRQHLPPASASAQPWFQSEDYRPSLTDALQIAAANSREFQDAKDRLFRAALALDLEADAFRISFRNLLAARVRSNDSGGKRQESLLLETDPGASRRFRNGAELSGSIAVDLVRLLTAAGGQSLGAAGDASISIPLLRGAGRLIAGEPLRQAEQNLVYAVYEFEHYKRQFAVAVAAEYLGVLLDKQRIRNEEENYKRLIATTRRMRRLADSGRRPELEFDQAVQNELSARNRWIQSQHSYQRSLDRFKLTLGLPTDAGIELDDRELELIQERTEELVGSAITADYSGIVPPADAPIEVELPDTEDAGALEIPLASAMRIALENRLDLRISLARIEDAQYQVLVAADRLRPELTLLGTASVGESRSFGSEAQPDAKIDFRKTALSGALTINLPLERTRERNLYRDSLIRQEKAVRDFQAAEDQVKLEVRDQLRGLAQARAGVLIQDQAVRLAEKRVAGSDLFLQAGRASIRDVLEAQDNLLAARNNLIAALVSYRIAELRLQRDLGKLEVSATGIWQEFNPNLNGENNDGN